MPIERVGARTEVADDSGWAAVSLGAVIGTHSGAGAINVGGLELPAILRIPLRMGIHGGEAAVRMGLPGGFTLGGLLADQGISAFGR